MPNSFGGPDTRWVTGLGYPGGVAIHTGTMSISGGDIQRGLGWATLALALAAAIAPYVATNLSATGTTRTSPPALPRPGRT